MAFDATLGLSLDGKQLPLIPPNATQEEQVAVLNDIINKLNNNTQEVVASGTISFPVSGSAQDVYVQPHRLGYKPRAFAYLDNVQFTIGELIYPHANIPLPTYLATNITGSGGGGGASSVDFLSWLDLFVDATNVYFHFNNPNAELIGESIPITYYLTRQPAN